MSHAVNAQKQYDRRALTPEEKIYLRELDTPKSD
jgi:hypothetical protein